MPWARSLPAPPDGQGARRLRAQREASGADRVPSILTGLYVECVCMTELGLIFQCPRRADGATGNRSWLGSVLGEERVQVPESFETG